MLILILGGREEEVYFTIILILLRPGLQRSNEESHRCCRSMKDERTYHLSTFQYYEGNWVMKVALTLCVFRLIHNIGVTFRGIVIFEDSINSCSFFLF